jgi:DNA invertase Pin-like site-specific DNA recombinase
VSDPKLAARYIRVSRADQRPELQDHETTELIARRGWQLVDTFSDHGVSGARDRRPGLDRMLEAARRGSFDLIVVWRADRLFRSLRHMVVTLDEFAALGVGFVSVTEPFDTTTPTGRLLLQLVGAFAEFERGVLIERTLAGLQAARRRGARLGRPPTAALRVDFDQVAEMRASGASIRSIARQLGVSAAAVQRVLCTPADCVCAECDSNVLCDIHGRARWHRAPGSEHVCAGFGQPAANVVSKTPDAS